METRNIETVAGLKKNHVYRYGNDYSCFGEYYMIFSSFTSSKQVQVKYGEFLIIKDIWYIDIPTTKDFDQKNDTICYIICERLLPRIHQDNRYVIHKAKIDAPVNMFELDVAKTMENQFKIRTK